MAETAFQARRSVAQVQEGSVLATKFSDDGLMPCVTSDVLVGLCADDAQRLMSGFFHRVHRDEPELVVIDQTTDTSPAAPIPAGADSEATGA